MLSSAAIANCHWTGSGYSLYIGSPALLTLLMSMYIQPAVSTFDVYVCTTVRTSMMMLCWQWWTDWGGRCSSWSCRAVTSVMMASDISRNYSQHLLLTSRSVITFWNLCTADDVISSEVVTIISYRKYHQTVVISWGSSWYKLPDKSENWIGVVLTNIFKARCSLWIM